MKHIRRLLTKYRSQIERTSVVGLEMVTLFIVVRGLWALVVFPIGHDALIQLMLVYCNFDHQLFGTMLISIASVPVAVHWHYRLASRYGVPDRLQCLAAKNQTDLWRLNRRALERIQWTSRSSVIASVNILIELFLTGSIGGKPLKIDACLRELIVSTPLIRARLLVAWEVLHLLRKLLVFIGMPYFVLLMILFFHFQASHFSLLQTIDCALQVIALSGLVYLLSTIVIYFAWAILHQWLVFRHLHRSLRLVLSRRSQTYMSFELIVRGFLRLHRQMAIKVIECDSRCFQSILSTYIYGSTPYSVYSLSYLMLGRWYSPGELLIVLSVNVLICLPAVFISISVGPLAYEAQRPACLFPLVQPRISKRSRRLKLRWDAYYAVVNSRPKVGYQIAFVGVITNWHFVQFAALYLAHLLTLVRFLRCHTWVGDE